MHAWDKLAILELYDEFQFMKKLPWNSLYKDNITSDIMQIDCFTKVRREGSKWLITWWVTVNLVIVTLF